MAREQKIICDRCGGVVPETDARLLEVLRSTYPGQDICPRCDSLLELAQVVTRGSLLSNQSPQKYLEDWLAQYE